MRIPRSLTAFALAVITTAAAVVAGSSPAMAAWTRVSSVTVFNAARTARVDAIIFTEDGEQWANLEIYDLKADGYRPRAQVEWLIDGPSFTWIDGPYQNINGNGTIATVNTPRWTNALFDDAYIWVWNGTGERLYLPVGTA